MTESSSQGFDREDPTVLTLDAGGTNFSFAALRGGVQVAGPYVLPSEATDRSRSLANLVAGFERMAEEAGAATDAISFAFPGPADYEAGVTFNVGNLPAYGDGLPLGDLLSEHFGVPVLINNDGNLFAVGEAIYGRLPEINRRLEEAGSHRRYRNLIGLTLGTGFGGGVVVDGELLRGDNGLAGEVWLLRHGFSSNLNAEEGISIRAVSRAYADAARDDPQASRRSPKEIARIADGAIEGDQGAAIAAYASFGRALGDAIASTITLIDGLVVIGGGLSHAHTHFMPSLLGVVAGAFSTAPDSPRRLVQCVYNLESDVETAAFLSPEGPKEEKRRTPRQPRSAVAISRLGANQAVALGAYELAARHLADPSIK